MAEQVRAVPPLSSFMVRCLRHPRHHPDAYDKGTHRFAPTYVDPESWLLDLDASAAVRDIAIPDPPDDLPRAEPEDHPEIRVPANVTGYHWIVERERGGRFVLVAEATSGRQPRTTVSVPTDGAREARFRVRLRVTITGAAPDLESTSTFRIRDLLIVSLGDSYASGEGNPDAQGRDEPLPTPLLRVLAGCPMRRDPVWQEPAAHRSWNSGPSFAAGFAQFRGATSPSTQQVIVAPTFLSFASSGATLANLTSVRQHAFQPGAQVAEARSAVGSRPIDAVIISAGGNDAGFSKVLRQLPTEGGDTIPVPPIVSLLLGWRLVPAQLLTFLATHDGEQARARGIAAAHQLIAGLPAKYAALATEVEEQLAPRHVFVTTYPERLFERQDGTSGACELFDIGELDVSAADIRAMDEAGRHLNGTIAGAVRAIAAGSERRSEWHLVDGVAAAFGRHGYCARDPYVRTAGESCEIQGDLDGAMHPNIAGIRAYAELIYAALDEHVLAIAPVPPDTPAPPRVDLDVTPTSLSFGGVPVGELRFKTVTVRNGGDVDLTIRSPARSSLFSWPAVATTLRPGQATSVQVRFLVSSAGNHSTTLTLTSASPGSPHRVAITGRGIGGTTNPPGDDGPIHPN